MMSRVIISSIVVLFAFLAISEGMSLRRQRSLGVEMHCRCTKTESRYSIRSHIEKVALFPANSHCEEAEIIATMIKTGQKVCLDPKAAWVKKLIARIMSSRRR